MARRGGYTGKRPEGSVCVTRPVFNRVFAAAASVLILCGSARHPPFDVFVPGSNDFTEFSDMAAALNHARAYRPSFIYHRGSGRLLWDNGVTLPASAALEAPSLLQTPELARGCEVTSLAMLLLSQGVKTDKLELAGRIKKEPAVYRTKDGRVFRGNPNKGFVGRMDSFKEAGYGVYHGPIAELLDGYMPGMALDLTGCEFGDLLYYPALGIPVWVIINTTYAPLPSSAFITWDTEQGPVRITYREHSVLLTGYDETRVYFNDPLAGRNSAGRNAFAAAWEQMGGQAVTVMP
ncbi:MAG: C39 family peptidase [Clostridiales bacterium]|jgi:uncharacterized protein YvpB|nr:C39 family peptidase [Clostridiales bacterium]